MEVNGRLSAILKPEAGYAEVLPIRFYTVPPLEQSEVRTLAGLPPIQDRSSPGSASDAQDLLVNTSRDIFFQTYVIRPFERNVRKALGVDFFSVQTGVFSEVTETMSIDDFMTNTAGYFRDTRITVGKYFGPGVYVMGDAVFLGESLASGSSNLWDLEVGLEFDLNPYSDLANFIFEYKMNPLDIQEHEFNLSTKWRF
jgi:hypothetical protein